MKCPYCGREAEVVTSKEFYGRDYGTWIYLCRPCDAYTGSHKGKRIPMGTMAKPQLRNLRRLCHERFDRLWRSGGMSRTEAYEWMSKAMGIKKDYAHIGLFDIHRCQRLLTLLREEFGLCQKY